MIPWNLSDLQQDKIMHPKCKHCGCEDQSMLEIEVIMNTYKRIFCNVCSQITIQICEPKNEK